MAEQRRSAKEIMTERRQRMEAMHPGYLLLNRKMMRLVYVALILRFFVFIIQRIVMGGGNMAAVIPLAAGTLFNILVGYVLYYCMLHFSWKIAPVYLAVNLFFGFRSAANLAGLVPTLPTPTLILLLCTYVQIIFEYGLLLAISLKRDVHEMQRLNRIVESGRPLGDEKEAEAQSTDPTAAEALEAAPLPGTEKETSVSALRGFAEARALLSGMKEEEAPEAEPEKEEEALEIGTEAEEKAPEPEPESESEEETEQETDPEISSEKKPPEEAVQQETENRSEV